MKKTKSLIALFMSILILTCILQFPSLTVSAAKADSQPTGYNLLSEAEFSAKIGELKNKYPYGSTPDYTYYENGTALAWTCHGFANKLAYYCFGCSIYSGDGGYSKSWDSSSFNAGDIVRVNNDGHTIFITYAVDDTIKYAEGNYDGYVRWDVTISKSDLQSRFTHKFHLNGNNLTGHPKSGIDYGDDFYGLIKTTDANITLGITADNNAAFINLTKDNNDRCIFHFTKVNNQNGYRICSVINGRFLDVSGGSDASGLNLWFYPYNDHPAQVWYFQDVHNSNGFTRVVAGCTSRCMDATGDVHHGANAETWDWNGGANQLFGLYKMDRYKIGINYGDDFYAQIKGAYSNKPIGQNDNYNVELMSETTNNYNHTIWHFKRINNYNAYRIISVLNGRYLDVSGGGDANYANLWGYPYNDHPAQEWYIQIRHGKTVMTPGCAIRYLDLNGGYTADGTNVQIFDYNGNISQQLSIDVISDAKINPTISADHEHIGSQSTATISVNNTAYFYNYRFHIIAPNGTETTVDNLCNNSYSLTPSQTGVYKIYAEVKNPYHTKSTDVINIVSCGIGDVNLDGTINIKDVTAIQRLVAELELLTDDQLALADTNGDGEINISDATHLQMYLAECDVVLGKQPS